MAFVLLDHNVARDIAPLLHQTGYGAITAWDAGMNNAEDDEYLLVSSQRGWSVATHNKKDFKLLHGAWRRWSAAWGLNVEHGGILILGESPPGVLAAALIELLAGDPLLASQLYEWMPGTGWAVGH